MLYYRKRDGYWIIMCTRRAVVIVIITYIIYVAEFECFSPPVLGEYNSNNYNSHGCKSGELGVLSCDVMKQKHFSFFVETKTSYFNKLVLLLCRRICEHKCKRNKFRQKETIWQAFQSNFSRCLGISSL